MQHLSHLLNGSARAIGAEQLASELQMLEANAAAGNISSASIQRLSVEMERVREYLERRTTDRRDH